MPRERGAFHTGWKFTNPSKRRKFPHFGCVERFADLPREHLADFFKKRSGFFTGFSFKRGGHHGGRSLGDGASRTVKADVLNHISFQFYIDLEMVAAKRIVTFHRPVGIHHSAKISRVPVMIHDHLLIKLANISVHRNTSVTSRSASANRSISSRVL